MTHFIILFGFEPGTFNHKANHLHIWSTNLILKCLPLFQTKQEKQLEELRQAGHETLSVIVEEYKCLLNASLQQQQEVNEQRLSDRLKEETERLREILKLQVWFKLKVCLI